MKWGSVPVRIIQNPVQPAPTERLMKGWSQKLATPKNTELKPVWSKDIQRYPNSAPDVNLQIQVLEMINYPGKFGTGWI